MIIDADGWCFDRTAEAMINYHNTDHEWIKWNPHTERQIPDADIYRVGGLPLFNWLGFEGYLNTENFIPTIASFHDGRKLPDLLFPWIDHAIGLIINDKRQEKFTQDLEIPVVYSPDYTDERIFYPMPELRPKSGPLRIGWAGSVRAWKRVKNVDEIMMSCLQTPGVEFVRQDREYDGQKNQDEMREWFNSLDLYVAANIEETCTPVPTLEAIACGVPVLTTRCGELWKHIEPLAPNMIIPTATAKGISSSIAQVGSLTREDLRELGERMHRDLLPGHVSWSCGEAKRITEVLVSMKEKLCR
jgi:hypothetical protein